MTVRVIDIETTGTDPTVDAIIEIASVDLLKDGTIANQRTALVRPPLPVPPEASAVHHLIDEDLAFAPQLDEVLDQFKGSDAYVAHNADFERSFLEHLLGDALWACTYKCALRIWPDLLSHSNQALRYRLGSSIPSTLTATRSVRTGLCPMPSSRLPCSTRSPSMRHGPRSCAGRASRRCSASSGSASTGVSASTPCRRTTSGGSSKGRTNCARR